MTVNEIIAQVDRLRPNNIDRLQKIKYLSSVDKYIYQNIIQPRAGGEGIVCPEYGEHDGGAVLLAPSPYDELYLYFLEAKIYYETREIKKYANSMAMYNQTMSEYMAWYFRDHAQRENVIPRYY